MGVRKRDALFWSKACRDFCAVRFLAKEACREAQVSRFFTGPSEVSAIEPNLRVRACVRANNTSGAGKAKDYISEYLLLLKHFSSKRCVNDAITKISEATTTARASLVRGYSFRCDDEPFILVHVRLPKVLTNWAL